MKTRKAINIPHPDYHIKLMLRRHTWGRLLYRYELTQPEVHYVLYSLHQAPVRVLCIGNYVSNYAVRQCRHDWHNLTIIRLFLMCHNKYLAPLSIISHSNLNLIKLVWYPVTSVVPFTILPMLGLVIIPIMEMDIILLNGHYRINDTTKCNSN